MIPAVLLPLAATGQVSPDRGSRSTDESEQPVYKWAVYAGYGYTSLNQVNQSRSGLQGGDVSITRDWGKYFGITGDGAYYSYPIDTPVVANLPALKPSVDLVLFGPVAHVEIWGKVSGFARGLLGGEHMNGTVQTPNISFAGGYGGGMEYKLTPRISLRASGDNIASSFSFIDNTSAESPHKHWNPRAGFGAVYRF
jgi:hypothetical protein